MKIKIIKSKKLSSLILLCTILLTRNVQSQAVYDTLYIFPDTTTFYDKSITTVGDIGSLAVRFSVDSSWDNYQIEKIIYVQPNGVDTNGFSYLFISLGAIPEDTIIFEKQVYWNNPSFPTSNEIVIETPIKIDQQNFFYLSGGFLFVLSISDYFDFGIPGEFAFWFTSYKWIEYVPCYFNLKVIVKKNLTDVKEETRIPCNFKLEQNYPNPFNPSTIINYQTQIYSKVTIKIFDLLGKEVATLVDSEKPAGKYEVEFNASSLSSGIYIVRLTAGLISATNKITLLK